SKERAEQYYRTMSEKFGFKSPLATGVTSLDELAAFLGYKGLTGQDLEQLPPDVLMNLGSLSRSDPVFANRQALVAMLQESPLRTGDILVSRFFAPKIVNFATPPDQRKLGWRRLIRLKARPGSDAARHPIESGIVLFNYTTEPGQAPFAPGVRSFNTQMILTT